MSFQLIKKYYFEMVPSLTEEIWAEMETKAIVQQYKKGEIYISPGEVEQYVSFINKGGFRYYFVVDDKEFNCDFSFENTYISEYESFLRQQPAKSYIQALEDSEVVKFHYNDVQGCYGRYPQLQQFGRRIAEELFLEVTERTKLFLFATPEERYNQLVESRPQLLQRVPQYMIASFLGVTPEALSRIRKRIHTLI